LCSAGSFHEQCFNCLKCSKNLMQDQIRARQRDERIYCHQCYAAEFLPPCAACLQPVEEGIQALDKSWHQSCFTCSKCAVVLEGGFRVQEDLPYCGACYRHYLLPKCYACNEPAENAVSTQAFPGRHWHRECFKCCACGEILEGSFSQRDGSLYCEACVEALLPKCQTCAKPLKGQVLTALGKQFHPSCFTCSECKQGMQGSTFYDIEGKVYCSGCFKNAKP